MPQIDKEDLLRINGIGGALAEALSARFPTWEELHEASDESLLATRGLRQSTIDNLRTVAEINVAREGLPKAGPELLSGTEAGSDGETKWVLREQRIDPNTVLRTRVKVRPSTCLEDGYDVCDHWGLRPFEELSEEDQAKVLLSLENYRRQNHSQPRVVTDSQLKEMTARSISKREAATA